MSDPDNLETPHKEKNTPRPSKMKRTKEVQYLSNTSGKTASMSPNRGDGEEVEAEQRPNEVEPPKDEVDPLKKRKVFPPKPSSHKKSKSTMTKMHTFLTSNDFGFIIAAINDASLEIEEKQATKQEEMYYRIEVEL
jgi:hypothetical protein